MKNESNKNKLLYTNEIKIGDTVFTVNHVQSKTAKKDIKSIIKGLILNNINNIN